MKHKKPSKTMLHMLELTRRIGIRASILPRNFPKAENINFRYVEDKTLNWAGFGGAHPDKNGKMKLFFVVNLAHNKTMQYFTATIAHELLHIKQFRNNGNINHDNNFRAACKKYAAVLGCDYYLLYGYDAPSIKTAKAKAKIMEKWFNTFRNRNEQKEKAFGECPIL